MPGSLDTQSRVSRPDHVLAQEAAGMIVLLDSRTGRYYKLDDVGARIWSLCDGERNAADIAAQLSDEYDAPPDVIAADALELLRDLVSERLLLCPS